MSSSAKDARYLKSSDGSVIYADASGNPSGRSIVFIHGQGLSGAVFDAIFATEAYLKEFYLVRFDMRGHGRSAKPDTIEGHASHLYAADFKAVLDAFKLHKPVVVGWSLGATLSADIAAHLPADTIAGLVYLTALPYIDKDVIMKVGKPLVLDLSARINNLESTETALVAMREFLDSVFLDATQVPWDLKAYWLGMIAMQSPKDRMFALSRPQDPAKLHELGKNGLPLLVLGAMHDSQVETKSVEEVMGPTFPKMKVAWIEERGSHAMFYDNMSATMEEIVSFTRSIAV